MVKVTNITDRPLSRRLASGAILNWSPGETKDVESKRLLEQVSRQECFVVGEEVGTKEVGGGLKTGVRKPKTNSKLTRAEPKEKVDCPKGSYKCKGVCKCGDLKKPKGLKKSKRAD
tara:strand:- start:108 stop:455 length:348 start_codon:yes stop_codon:yes gene_type:complete